jgi:hypothetical protein
LAAAVLATATPALAQSGASPATAPATAPVRPPYKVTPPPGFTRIDQNGCAVYAAADDAAWVKEALTRLTPATKPSTTPSDLVDRLQAQRAKLKEWLAADLLITDAAGVDKLIDETLVPQAKALQAVNPPVFYLVGTPDSIKALLKGGWSDPRFYYNRAADDVIVRPGLSLSSEGPMDETVIPVVIAPGDTPAQRGEKLINTVRDAQAGVQLSVSQRAHLVMQVGLIEFIDKQLFTPLALKDDQKWFATGVAGVQSAKYITQISGMAYQELIIQMIVEPSDTPYPARAVNLLRPADTNAMRPEYVPFYRDAFRRKSTAVTFAVNEKSNAKDWLPKVLKTLKKGRVEGGNALLEILRQETGVELETWVQ